MIITVLIVKFNFVKLLWIILSDDENYVSVKQYKKTEERELFYKNHKAEISRLEGSYEKAVFMNFVKRGDKRGMRYYYSFMSSIKKKKKKKKNNTSWDA